MPIHRRNFGSAKTMTIADTLLAEYPGDGPWHRFAALASSSVTTVGSELDVEELVAAVLMRKFGSPAAANEWLRKPLPILNGGTAIELLASPDGKIKLRTLLMRMP